MRQLLPFITFVFACSPIPAAAQTLQELQDDVARLRQEFREVGDSYDRRKSRYDQSARIYNSCARQLADSRRAVASHIAVMNNVIKFPKKADLLKHLRSQSRSGLSSEARSVRLVASNLARNKVQSDDLDWSSLDAARQNFAQGDASRIRIVNPYNDSTYERYYDNNGDWQYSNVENDYNATQIVSDDWTKHYDRARDAVETLTKQYQDLQTQYDQITANQSQIAAQLQDAQNRLNQFATPQTPPRPTVPPDNVNPPPPSQSGPDSDGVVWRQGYPDLDAGKMPPGWRGPRWVRGRLVSP